VGATCLTNRTEACCGVQTRRATSATSLAIEACIIASKSAASPYAWYPHRPWPGCRLSGRPAGPASCLPRQRMQLHLGWRRWRQRLPHAPGPSSPAHARRRGHRQEPAQAHPAPGSPHRRIELHGPGSPSNRSPPGHQSPALHCATPAHRQARSGSSPDLPADGGRKSVGLCAAIYSHVAVCQRSRSSGLAEVRRVAPAARTTRDRRP